MILVTRLNREEFYINPYHIEFMEKTPDTVISMTTGKKVVVLEPVELIIDRIVEFQRRICTDLPKDVTTGK